MRISAPKRLILGALLLPLGSMTAGAQQEIANPQVNGYALDFCLNWATNCGKPAADAYCSTSGLGTSITHTVQNDEPPTFVIGDGVVCNGNACDRISSVTCTGGGGKALVIDAPTVNGYAVDICLNWGANCGKPAADAYCASNDYGTSVGHVVQNDAPPTLVIGDKAVCNQAFCDRFASITCSGG